MDVVRLVVTQRTDDKWGDASRGTSPTDTQGLSVELCQNKKTDTLPSGRWQDNQTPTTLLWIRDLLSEFTQVVKHM